MTQIQLYRELLMAVAMLVCYLITPSAKEKIKECIKKVGIDSA